LRQIFLCHPWDRDRFRTFRKELHAHVPRIRHLQISANPILLHAILEGLVSPAPTLEHLSLSSPSKGEERRGVAGQPSLTLFDGFTPRLSRLELRNCGISWRSKLLKGLKYLKICNPSATPRPELAVWLAALDEMPQLTTLTLRWASPIAPPFPFVVRHTVTLPSLTSLDIYASLEDCALALAHLDLPALTSLCLTAFSVHLPIKSDVQQLLPFIVRDMPMDRRTLSLCRVCLSAVKITAQTSLRDLCPISASRCTICPLCSPQRPRHV
jgi:hypothetical protein